MVRPELLIILTIIVIISCQEYRICAKPGRSNECQQISRNGTFSCEENFHRVDCLLNVDAGITSFGLVKAEEAFLAAPLTSNLVVIGEKHGLSKSDDPLQTVVIVKYNHEGGLKDLRNKKYCHPGFQFEGIVTPLILQEFEKSVLVDNAVDICDSNGTITEKYTRALYEFFGPSCRPGPWTEDTELDKSLKKMFYTLCSLCVYSSCETEIKDPFTDALKCLLDRDADVAVSSLSDALVFFNNSENSARYKYLCPDGIASAPDLPCVWTKQIPDVIVANKDIAEGLPDKLRGFLRDYEVLPEITPYSRSIPNDILVDNLLKVLGLRKDTDRLNFTAPVDLKTYVADHRPIPDSKSELCQTNVKWCTTSDAENEKCIWLAQASLNRGIQPALNCVQSSDSLECLGDIQNEKADVTTVSANYGYIAKRKNLAAIAFPETEVRDLKVILTVIKQNSSIERFENLRDKQACFPEYGGIEWLTWIDIGRIRGILPKDTCDYGLLISNFVGASCVPGALDNSHEVTSNTNRDKLCEMCTHSTTTLSNTYKNCNADETNYYFANEGALHCLNEVGDFAVITRQDFTDINTDSFRVLCKNGSLAAYPGLNVDVDCALAEITTSEVVSRRSSTKNADIKVLLHEYERWFGVSSNKPFELYNQFNGTKDLLFKDSTPGLEFDSTSNKFIENYVALFSHIDHCAAEGKSSASILSVFTLLTGLSIFIIALL